MRTKVTIYIGHMKEELTERELEIWLEDQLQKMLNTKGGMTGFTIKTEVVN